MTRLLFMHLAFAVLLCYGGGGPLSAQSDDVLRIGVDAYVYAYPLVLMDVTRQYVEKRTGGKNVLLRSRVLSKAPLGKDDNFFDSAAWFDLSTEPLILHMPDFGDRYHRVQFMDGWTHISATVVAGNGPRDFAVVGPQWKGDLPEGVAAIHSSTDMALIQARVHSRSSIKDIAGVYALQDRMSLTPLSRCGLTDSAPIVQALPVAPPPMPPADEVADMDGRAFFTRFSALLRANPPPAADAKMMAKLADLGIVPGPDFNFDKLDPLIREGLSKSISPAQAKIGSSRPINEPNPAAYYLSMARSALTLATNLPADPIFRDPDTPDPIDRIEMEDDIPVDSGILFNSEGHRSVDESFDIGAEIERGREFLKDKTAGHSVTVKKENVAFLDKKGRRKEKLVSTKIVRPNFLLAVEDLKERKIRQVRITEKGCTTEGFRVTRIRDNGVASRFEVAYPDDMVILALRTTVRSGNKGLKEVVYTPYSPEIDTWQVRKAGLDYLKRQIESARNDLAAKKVRLDGFDETGDVMPVEVSLVLSIIEHIDPDRFEHHQGNKIALVHEVLTIIGANTTTAYSYSKSPAGARGLFQIVPDTYRRLQEKYRGAGLHKDFVLGCDDHTNAAKASLLLFDSDLASLPRKLLAAGRKDGRSIGMYLAAAYNCGSARVGRSARECKSQWTCLLPEETKVYLKKFDTVWNLRKVLDQ